MDADATDGVQLLWDGADIVGSWIDQELAGSEFADERLGRRFGVLMGQFAKGLGTTIPLACGDWANTKAAYRFLDNDRVSEAEILAGHFASTRDRFAAIDGPVLVLHDTTEFSFTRENAGAIGVTRKVAIHASERGTPKGRDRIEWKLVTNLPVNCRADAIEKLEWYALRWKIEMFHKVLKSGCRAEDSKLRTADRLANLIAMMCILAWRVLWLTMLNRASPELPAKLVFTDVEIKLLEHLVPRKDGATKKTAGRFLTLLARLGGYLNRTRDAPPGNMVLWRGMTRLTDIHLGYCLARDVGN